jgi:hypothetical protein
MDLDERESERTALCFRSENLTMGASGAN